MLPDQSVPWDSLFGRLSLDSLPLGSGPEDRIVQYTFLVVAIIGLAILAAITWKRKWGYLWKEWLTSVDHKKLGIMYMILGTVMLLRSEEHTSELQSLMRISYAVFCLKKKKNETK